MSKTVTVKSTKQEIFEAYTTVKNRLDALDAMKDDPNLALEKAENARIAESAEKMVGLGILSPEIVSAYKDLEKSIEEKKKLLNELYGIEAEANSMVALINAHKDKEVELKEKYAEMESTLKADIAEKKAILQADIEEIIKQKNEELAAKRKENTDLQKALKVERDREEEEYEYNLKRARKQETDKWNDEKDLREKALAEREKEVALRETTVSAQKVYIAEMEAKVSEIPTLVETATKEGIKKGESDAGKSYAFEKRAIETKNEYEQKALKDKIERLEKDLESAKEANEVLQDKLDAAYAQMKELASETVKSTGGVKILDRENNSK